MDTLAALGAWPTPKLDTAARFIGLTGRQWLYVGGGYALWDYGRPLLPAAMAPAWVVCCVLLAACGALVHWHGLDLWHMGNVLLAYGSTPRLSVWRPVETTNDTQEPENDDERADNLDEADPTPANPAGWALDGLAAAAGRAGAPLTGGATGTSNR